MPSRAISAHSTEAPGSTSDLIGNVGSTTRRFNAQQLLGAIFTSQGQIAYAPSSRNSTFLNPPTSGAVLTYSSGSSAPSWSIPTSGAVLIASSISVPTWRAVGTSGHLLQSTGGSPAWVGLTANTLFKGNSSGEIVEVAAGTSGQKLVAAPSPTFINDVWSLSVMFDAGSGSTLTTGIKGTVLIPWKVGISKNELVANTTGDLVIDIYSDALSSTPASSTPKITASAPPTLTNAQRSSDATLTGWTTAISTAGNYLTFDITAASSGIQWAVLSLQGNKLSTV